MPDMPRGSDGSNPPRGPLRLSVIIPLGPGETEEGPLLDALRDLPTRSEVLLVSADDGARAAPPHWPAALPFRPIATCPGRARQMNLGARSAAGAWLWFLHADTRFTPGTLPALERFLARGEDAIGWFDLAFRADGPRLARLNAWGANRRSAWFGLPFGDQGLVLPAAAFARLGGYDEAAPYGEDHLLVWLAHGRGLPLRRIGAGLSTSARKYARGGWGATTWLHWRLTLLQAWGAWRRNRRERSRER